MQPGHWAIALLIVAVLLGHALTVENALASDLACLTTSLTIYP
jgi:hypothetical protein